MDMTPDMPVPQDTWVAITDWELREVTMHMPGRQTVPVTTRGFDADQVLVVEGSAPGGLHALAALARMRQCVSGPMVQEPESDAQEPVQPQESTDSVAPLPSEHPQLLKLADTLQDAVETFMRATDVDERKHDHQNRAGDLVDAILGILRSHDVLPGAPLPPNAARIARDWYLSNRQSFRAAVARAVSTVSVSSLRESQAIGQQMMSELDDVMEGRR